MKFIHNNTTYQEAGQLYDYFYDEELSQMDYCPSSDPFEMTRFLYAIWARFGLMDEIEAQQSKHSVLFKKLNEYFKPHDGSDFAYWALVDYTTLSQFNTKFESFKLNEKTKELTLKNDQIELIVEPDYDRFFGEDKDGDVYEIDEAILPSLVLITYEGDDDANPILFMSDEQIESSLKSIDKIMNEIIEIFKSEGINVQSGDELLKFCNQN